MNFDNLMPYDLMTALYRFIPFLEFDFALLTLTVFTTLRNSMREKNRIHSVETVSEVRQKSNVKIVIYVKRKT